MVFCFRGKVDSVSDISYAARMLDSTRVPEWWQNFNRGHSKPPFYDKGTLAAASGCKEAGFERRPAQEYSDGGHNVGVKKNVEDCCSKCREVGWLHACPGAHTVGTELCAGVSRSQMEDGRWKMEKDKGKRDGKKRREKEKGKPHFPSWCPISIWNVQSPVSRCCCTC